MRKFDFWKADWFLGVAVVIVVVLFNRFSDLVPRHQLLSGKLPFEGESMAQLMFKMASEPPADILAVNPSVPPGPVAADMEL